MSSCFRKRKGLDINGNTRIFKSNTVLGYDDGKKLQSQQDIYAPQPRRTDISKQHHRFRKMKLSISFFHSKRAARHHRFSRHFNQVADHRTCIFRMTLSETEQRHKLANLLFPIKARAGVQQGSQDRGSGQRICTRATPKQSYSAIGGF
jgi:hypothetical protein